jgi:hypothetical protein
VRGRFGIRQRGKTTEAQRHRGEKAKRRKIVTRASEAGVPAFMSIRGRDAEREAEKGTEDGRPGYWETGRPKGECAAVAVIPARAGIQGFAFQSSLPFAEEALRPLGGDG